MPALCEGKDQPKRPKEAPDTSFRRHGVETTFTLPFLAFAFGGLVKFALSRAYCWLDSIMD